MLPVFYAVYAQFGAASAPVFTDHSAILPIETPHDPSTALAVIPSLSDPTIIPAPIQWNTFLAVGFLVGLLFGLLFAFVFSTASTRYLWNQINTPSATQLRDGCVVLAASTVIAMELIQPAADPSHLVSAVLALRILCNNDITVHIFRSLLRIKTLTTASIAAISTSEISVQTDCSDSNGVLMSSLLIVTSEASVQTECTVLFADQSTQTPTAPAPPAICTTEIATQTECVGGEDDATETGFSVSTSEMAIQTECTVLVADQSTQTPTAPAPLAICTTEIATQTECVGGEDDATETGFSVSTSEMAIQTECTVLVADQSTQTPTAPAPPAICTTETATQTECVGGEDDATETGFSVSTSEMAIQTECTVLVADQSTQTSPALAPIISAPCAICNSGISTLTDCDDEDDATETGFMTIIEESPVNLTHNSEMADCSALASDDPFLTQLATTFASTSEVTIHTLHNNGDSASVASSTDYNSEGSVTDEWMLVPNGSGHLKERSDSKIAQKFKSLKKQASTSTFFSLRT